MYNISSKNKYQTRSMSKWIILSKQRILKRANTTAAGCMTIIGLESVLKPSHCVKNDDVIEWEHEET